MMTTQDMKAIAGSRDMMFLCVLCAGSEAMQSMAVPNVLLRQISATIYGSGWRSEGTLLTASDSLSSGARQRNIGYEALLWYEILSGEVRGLGTYPFAQILPDKIARFLFDFHHKEFRSLELPDLPDNRGQLDVHRMLNIRQVRAHMKRGTCKIL